MPEPKGPESQYSQLRLTLPPLLLVAALAFGSGLAQTAPAGPDFVYADKLAHFLFYGLLGTLVFRRMRMRFLDNKRWLLAFLATMTLGIGEEILQHFNPSRTFDLYDWLADSVGALLAIALYRNWGFYRELLEFRLWRRLAKRG